MGVLDRLESEARQSRTRREQAAAVQSRDAAASLSRLAPALVRVRTYLESLAGHLNEMDRQIVADYRIDGVGELTALAQSRYRVAVADDGRGLSFSFDCEGRGAAESAIAGHPKADAIARSLKAAGLTCRTSPRNDRVMELRVEPKITARVVFVPDLERGQLALELHNLEEIGVQRYPLTPEQVDDALLDAVANLVLREPSALADLTHSVVDDDRRAALARQIGRDRRRREAEISGGARRVLFPILEWFRRRFGGG